MPEDVRRFWFEEIPLAQRRRANPDFDARAHVRCAPLHVTAVAAEPHRWRSC